MRLLLILLPATVACKGKDGDPDGTPPGDTTDHTGATLEETAPDGNFLDAAYWAVSAHFAVEASSQNGVRFGDADDGLQPIAFTVTLLSPDALYVGVTESTSCSATFESDGPLPVASWVAPNGAWIGYDFPLDGTVHDQCQFYGLPPEFQGELASHVRKWRWGMGLAELSEDVETALRQQLPASEWDAISPYVVGGAIDGSLFSLGTTGTTYRNAGYGLGFEVDGSMVLRENGIGDPIPVPSGAIHDAVAGVATGYYEVSVGVFEQPIALTY